ncbi:hypothetical protein EE612_051592, partial [Oryza sativa]
PLVLELSWVMALEEKVAWWRRRW